MAKARTPRQSWVDEGLRVLATGGPEAVRIEVLAKNLGVTKGGFYGYFADRKELLDAMLESWERQVADDVLAKVEQEGGDLQSQALRAQDLTFSEALFPIELAMRDWSRRDPHVAAYLHRVDATRIGLLRKLFASKHSDPVEVEARSTLAFHAAIGAHFVAIDHEGISLDEVDARIAALILGQ